MTISSAYSAHFSDMYINGKENAKLTGYRMKMLILSLPFMVRNLIAPGPEVISGDIPGTRRRVIPESELTEVQQAAEDLLESL